MSAENWFVKKPCKHCPYRNDVKPFLTPERGEDLAYLATNSFNSFPCHKTTEHDDDGEAYCTESTKQCAGFLTLMASVVGEHVIPDGFEPSYGIVYTDELDMIDAYENPDLFEDPN